MKKRFFRFENILITLILFILFIFVLYPALKTLILSVKVEGDFSFSNYILLFTTKGYLTAFKNTIILGILTVFVCGITGTALAMAINFFEFPFKKFVDKLLLLPLVLPGLIIVFAFVQLYGESGLITQSIMNLFDIESVPYVFSGLSGILFVHCYTQYVYFYINVSVGIKTLDKSVLEAAKNLGASNFKIFWSIIFPFLRPAIIASSILTFMTGIGSFSAPSIIGGSYKVMTTQILLSKANNYMDVAAAQVIVLGFVAIIYLGLMKYYEKKTCFENSIRAVETGGIKFSNKIIRNFVFVFIWFIIILIILPVITIIILSFVKPGTWMIDIYPREFSLDNYIRIFSKARGFEPFKNSISMSLISGIFCLFMAVPISYLSVKTKNKFNGLIDLLVMIPFAMPSSAIAINMINAFSKNLVGTYIILPLAYFVSMLPLMVRSTNISFYQLNNGYIEASRSLGAKGFETFRKISLPIISPGIIGGFLLVFIRGLGEYTMSVFLYTPGNRPISIAMVNSVFDYKIGLAMAYGALIVIITFILTAIIRRISL